MLLTGKPSQPGNILMRFFWVGLPLHWNNAFYFFTYCCNLVNPHNHFQSATVMKKSYAPKTIWKFLRMVGYFRFRFMIWRKKKKVKILNWFVNRNSNNSHAFWHFLQMFLTPQKLPRSATLEKITALCSGNLLHTMVGNQYWVRSAEIQSPQQSHL